MVYASTLLLLKILTMTTVTLPLDYIIPVTCLFSSTGDTPRITLTVNS